MIIINYIDIILFCISTFTVLYLLLFSLLSMIEKKGTYNNKTKYYFAIIIPLYNNEDIFSTIKSITEQDYPIDCYDIIIIANELNNEIKNELSKLPINLFETNFMTDVEAYNYSINHICNNNYDIALLLNSDDIITPNLLNKINENFSPNDNAIQCHKIYKNRSTIISNIEAISDEINNSIFRRGHVAIGLSSSLNSSGLAFDYYWFSKHIKTLNIFDNEKALESQALKDKIFIEYLNDAYIQSTNINKSKTFYDKRSKWIYSHYNSLTHNIINLPKALLYGNFDYVDRIIQWVLYPKSILLCTIIICGTVTIFFDWTLCLKWWLLFFILLFSIAISIPDYLVDNKFSKSILYIPILGIGLIFKMILKKKK